MVQFKPVQTTSSSLSNLSKVAGQFIVVTDTGDIYLDATANNRVALTEDEVEQYSLASGFPATGSMDKLYVDRTNNNIYRYNGSGYTLLTKDPSSIWTTVETW